MSQDRNLGAILLSSTLCISPHLISLSYSFLVHGDFSNFIPSIPYVLSFSCTFPCTTSYKPYGRTYVSFPSIFQSLDFNMRMNKWMSKWYMKREKEQLWRCRKSLTDKAIFELLLNDQWELAKVRSKQDISGLRRSWAFLGAVELSASPGQERQLNKWLKMNLEKATGNLKGSWDPTGEFGLNF